MTPVVQQFIWRALVVEDKDTDARMLQATLAEAPIQFDYAATLAAAVVKLATTPYDVILLDPTLPDATPLEAIRIITAQHGAVVAVTGYTNGTTGEIALREGCEDWFRKGSEAAVIQKAIQLAIETKRRRDAEAKLLGR